MRRMAVMPRTASWHTAQASNRNSSSPGPGTGSGTSRVSSGRADREEIRSSTMASMASWCALRRPRASTVCGRSVSAYWGPDYRWNRWIWCRQSKSSAATVSSESPGCWRRASCAHSGTTRNCIIDGGYEAVANPTDYRTAPDPDTGEEVFNRVQFVFPLAATEPNTFGPVCRTPTDSVRP